MAKKKFYVVWVGRKPGIYSTWAECAEQVNGFNDAKYKSFSTEAQAQTAFESGWQDYIGRPTPLSAATSRITWSIQTRPMTGVDLSLSSTRASAETSRG